MTIPVHKIPVDVGSEELRLTRLQVNALLQFVDDLLAAIAASDVAGNLKAGVAAVDVSVLEKVVGRKEPPAPPRSHVTPTKTA